MNWLREHRLFTVISGIVLLLCLVIIISFLTAGGSSFLGRGAHTLVHKFEKPLMTMTSGVRNTVAGVISYNEIKEENELLKARVEELETENNDLSIKREELKQLKKLSKSFDFEPYQGRSKAVAARITELDSSNPYVVFTVDAGSDKGIRKDYIVVDGNGLVGRVMEVGSDWSKVVSILSQNNNISFRVTRKPSISGVVQANNKGELEGFVMNEKAKIVKGDTLVTSGVGIYPEGIKIGKVKEVDYDENRQLKVITLTPTVTFDSLQKVAIFK